MLSGPDAGGPFHIVASCFPYGMVVRPPVYGCRDLRRGSTAAQEKQMSDSAITRQILVDASMSAKGPDCVKT